MQKLIDEAETPLILGDEGLQQFRLMEMFAKQIGNILDLFADTRQPRSFEELRKYGFDDPPT
jgi:hypothetical protein